MHAHAPTYTQTHGGLAGVLVVGPEAVTRDAVFLLNNLLNLITHKLQITTIEI